MPGFRLPRLTLFPGFFALEKELPGIDVRSAPLVLRRIAVLALAHWGRLLVAAGCALGGRVFDLMQPLLLGMAVNQAAAILTLGPAHAAQAQAVLMRVALMVIGVMTASGVLNMISGYEGEYVSQQVAYKLRLDFFAQLQRLSFGYHDKIHSGDLITRGMLDIEGARAFIQNGMMMALTLVLLLGVAAWRMIAADPVMAAIGLAFTPIAGVVLARMGFWLRVTWLQVQRLMSVLTLTMEENLQGIRVVRAFAAKAFEMAKFDQAANAALAYSYRRIVL